MSCALTSVAAQQEGDVRLAGEGTRSYEGRLEVYYTASWTSVCFEYANKDAKGVARVVCRQLGFYDYTSVGNVTKLG